MKYKLLKDYPPYKKGDILYQDGVSYHIGACDKKNREVILTRIIENNSDFFAPYVFTTEDNVDIFKKDMYHYVDRAHGVFSARTQHLSYLIDGNIRFSTKEKAQEYLDSLKVEWVICIYDDTSIYGDINKIYKVLENFNEYSWKLEFENGNDHICNKNRFRKATKIEIEAHKLGFHIGDKVWMNLTRVYMGEIESFKNLSPDNIKVFVVRVPNKGSNYILNDLTNKKPVNMFTTEEGNKLYTGDKSWRVNINGFVYANWTGITAMYTNGYGYPKIKYFSKKENAEQYFAELQAEKEGIKVGTEIFSYPEKIYQGQVTGIIYSEEHLGNIAFYLNRNINNIYTLKRTPESNIYLSLEELAKEEWENKQKGSDLDIEKTCESCAEYPNEKGKDPCNWCVRNHISNYQDHYKVKELEFEIGKWYQYINNKAFACYQGNDDGYGFSDGKWYNDYGWKWIQGDWKLANMEEIKKLLHEKAKKDYPKGTKFKNISTEYIQSVKNNNHKVGDNSTTINCGASPREEWSDVTNNKGHSNPFIYEKGKWAEIVEEPKLMLGNTKVDLRYLDPTTGIIHKDPVVWTNKGFVTFKHWTSWYNKVLNEVGKSTVVTEFQLPLGDYKTILHPKAGIDNSIGCITSVSWKNIDDITKAIKRYYK